MVLSAGISSIRDGQKLVGTAIDYLKSETSLKTLGIKEPNSTAFKFYIKMGFNMDDAKNSYLTPIENLNSDINIFTTTDGSKRRSKRKSKKRQSSKRKSKRKSKRRSRRKLKSRK